MPNRNPQGLRHRRRVPAAKSLRWGQGPFDSFVLSPSTPFVLSPSTPLVLSPSTPLILSPSKDELTQDMLQPCLAALKGCPGQSESDKLVWSSG